MSRVWMSGRRREQRGDAEEEHGNEAQSGPAVAVAAAWFTLCQCGGGDRKCTPHCTARRRRWRWSPVWRRRRHAVAQRGSDGGSKDAQKVDGRDRGRRREHRKAEGGGGVVHTVLLRR